MALTASAPVSAGHWLAAQGLLHAAQETGQAPLLQALRPCGTAWARMSYWGMRFTPGTLRELQNEAGFVAACGRGEVAALVSATLKPESPAAPLWLVALSTSTRPPLYLPPLVDEVEVVLPQGGSGRYRFETMIYALAAS
jgi:hypothetical protein